MQTSGGGKAEARSSVPLEARREDPHLSSGLKGLKDALFSSHLSSSYLPFPESLCVSEAEKEIVWVIIK